jgi:hypothetical protein
METGETNRENLDLRNKFLAETWTMVVVVPWSPTVWRRRGFAGYLGDEEDVPGADFVQ